MEKKDLKSILKRYMTNYVFGIKDTKGEWTGPPGSAGKEVYYAEIDKDLQVVLDYLNKYDARFYQVLIVEMDYHFSQIWFHIGGSANHDFEDRQEIYQWAQDNRDQFIILEGFE